MPDSHSIYSLPLTTAIEDTARWRQSGATVKAFTIEVQELIDVIDELKVAGAGGLLKQIRVYFGLKADNTERLILCGVDSVGNDIVAYTSRGIELPGTYDFTRPCPDTCPTDSPLCGD